MSNVEFQWKTFETLNRWVLQADGKAVALLSANGVITGIVFVHLDKIVLELHERYWLGAIGVLALVCLIFSFFYAINCVLPRFSKGEAKSITYFYHIAQLTEEQYEERMKEVLSVPHGAEKELTYQIWANSKVASRKFHCIYHSILWLIAALILFLCTGILYFGMNG